MALLGLALPVATQTAAAATSWSSTTLTPPGSTSDAQLTSVSCVSATHCVAVGYYGTNTGGFKYLPLVATFASGTWTEKTLPKPSTNTLYADLFGVSCTSTTSCVAVGSDQLTGGTTGPGEQGFFEVLSGSSTTWAMKGLVASPAGSLMYLYGISCWTGTTCLAVGNYTPTTGTVQSTPVDTTFNGTTWSSHGVTRPSTNPKYGSLSGVSCTAATCRLCGREVVHLVGAQPGRS